MSAISVGVTHGCGLTGGVVRCWGSNVFGEAGVTTVNAFTDTVWPAAGVSEPVTAVSAGVSHTCAIGASGLVHCWGANGDGQVGRPAATTCTSGGKGPSSPCNPVPGSVAGLSNIVAISAGAGHTCALDGTGKAWCWGRNVDGQLGDGTPISRTAPAAVAGNLSFAAISAGNGFTCGISATGDLYCWGYNPLGQLGITGAARTVPTQVPGIANVMTISAGGEHACAITLGGSAWCWGNNSRGQVGSGGSTSAFFQPTGVAGALSFRSISAGAAHTCGLTTAGIAYCWGGNDEGRLGVGPSRGGEFRTPQRVVGQP